MNGQRSKPGITHPNHSAISRIQKMVVSNRAMLQAIKQILKLRESYSRVILREKCCDKIASCIIKP